LHLLLTEIK